MFGALIGTITRLPKVVVYGGAVYAAGSVVSAAKSVLAGDSAGEVGKRALKSWAGLSRTTGSTKKKSKKKPAAKKAAAARVKKAIKRAIDTPTAANVRAMAAAAAKEGINLPPALDVAVKTL